MKTCIRSSLRLLAIALLLSACSAGRPLAEEDFQPADRSGEEIIRQIPDYSTSLQTVEGSGRAIVSEPGNNERVTVSFASTRQKSLLQVRNSIGIHGGTLLSDGDTLLIHNRIDNHARKIPIDGGELSRIDHLASINILRLLNYPVPEEAVRSVRQTESRYLLEMQGGSAVQIDRQSYLVRQVDHSDATDRPWSRIIYEAYGEIDGYTIPRIITIFSADGRSKISFQIRSIELNPELDPLTIDLPDNIDIYYR